MKALSKIHYLLFFCMVFLPSLLWAQKSLTVKEIANFEINSAISPATFRYLERIKALSPETAILIKLNTPGGLVSTTKDILTLLGSQQRPVIIWVTPEGASATSAGAILSSAAHFLFMNEGTNIGAATPIGLGSDIKENDQRSKAVNDLVALVKSLSESRGRPQAPFIEMIERAKSYTANEALKLKFIDGIIYHRSDLISAINGKTVQIQGEKTLITVDSNLEWKEMEFDFADDVLNVIAHPSTAYILFIIGVALIYFELQAPGGYIAGSIGVICLLLAALAFQVLPLNWVALGLLLAGIVFLVLEIYITSYGLLALAGIGSFIAGSLFLFDSKEAWLMVNYQVLYSTLAAVTASVGLLTWYLVNENKKLSKIPDFFIPLNETGTVLNRLDSDFYQIKVRGEIWKAQSTEELQANDNIQVLKQSDRDHLVLIVKKA
jgi:membrane-bound serine protease (ClpP class)